MIMYSTIYTILLLLLSIYSIYSTIYYNMYKTVALYSTNDYYSHLFHYLYINIEVSNGRIAHSAAKMSRRDRSDSVEYDRHEGDRRDRTGGGKGDGSRTRHLNNRREDSGRANGGHRGRGGARSQGGYQQSDPPRGEWRRDNDYNRQRWSGRERRDRPSPRDRRSQYDSRSRARAVSRSRSRSPPRHSRRDDGDDLQYSRRGGASTSDRSSSKGQSELPTDPEELMRHLMGFSGFDSTQGKTADANRKSAAGKGFVRRGTSTRQYRQYMNRAGGFNRPLDAPKKTL